MRRGRAGSPDATETFRCTTLATSSSWPTNVPQAERRTWQTWKCSGKCKAKNTPHAEQGPGADCLQRPVRRSSSCNIPIADGKDSEDILGSAAYLNPKGRGDK